MGRWLWFTPITSEAVGAYFGPLLDRQADELAADETPLTAVFAVEELSGEFLASRAAERFEA